MKPKPRVLGISNMYPPHHLGGYEIVHAGADRWLRERGYEVRALTTDHHEPTARGVAESADVYRQLRWYWKDHEFPKLKPRQIAELELHNQRVLANHLDEFQPDVVVWWAMGGMSGSLLSAVRERGIAEVSVIHDLWPIYGPRVDQFRQLLRKAPFGRSMLAKQLGSFEPSGPIAPMLLNSQLLADELVQAGAIAEGWRVVAPGVSSPVQIPSAKSWQGKLLCLGRLDDRKGIDLALQATIELGEKYSLTVVGGGDERVATALMDQADSAGAANKLNMVGQVPRESTAELFAEHDALIFPVRWSEPFGLVPLEALAHGLPVIATSGGGHAEYLEDGVNALIVEHESPSSIANAVRRLAADPKLRQQLIEAGRQTAAAISEDHFRAEVEAAILQVSDR